MHSQICYFCQYICRHLPDPPLMRKFDKPAVAAVSKTCPKEVRTRLLRLRGSLFDSAAQTPPGYLDSIRRA